jgi:hypothetical protein
MDRQLMMDTPSKPVLPQTNKYTLPEFYVRACYDEYFEQTCFLLNQYDLVSITGSKGL